jgi:G3E family GTPase
MSQTAAPLLPLTVIAGYLGAGKTTLINQLLAAPDGRRIMVLVNDFGDIALDAELISARGGDTISLSNGCVCCAIGGDIFKAFAKALDARPRPEHLIIEASGVAEPNRIANFARAEPELRLDMIVTLVDAVNARAQAADPLIGRTLHRQFEAASLLMITKSGRAGQEQAMATTNWLAELCPDTPIAGEDAGPEILFNPVPTLSPMPAQISDQDQAHNHEDMYERWSVSAPGATTEFALRALLEGLPAGILRLKGIADSPSGELEFHIAGRHQDVHASPATPAQGIRVVAIGLAGELPVEELTARFEALADAAKP